MTEAWVDIDAAKLRDASPQQLYIWAWRADMDKDFELGIALRELAKLRERLYA